MAAISHVFTLRRAAQILDRDERLLWDLSDQLEPEDGMLWIHDIDDAEILAFTNDGIEALREIIRDQSDRGPHRVLTLRILTLMLLLASPAMAAGGVPRLDIQKTCRAVAKLDPIDQTAPDCVSQEMDARARLEKQWASFAPTQRSACIEETNIGASPSYVEVQTCLEMKRDASSPPAPPRGQTSK